MDLTSLQAAIEKKRDKESQLVQHAELQDSFLDLQATVIKSFATLVDYLDRRVSRTEVINQLKQIGTPDAYEVVKAVHKLDETIQNKPGVDLTEVTSLLKEVAKQTSEIPKDKVEIEIPEQKFVDYSDQLADLRQIVENIVEAIKAQKTVVEAPVVNVPETVVNVPEIDLKPIEKGLEKVKSAVEGIEIPKTDLSKVEKEQVKQTKLLKEIVEKPVGGGGGGGSSWTAINEDGVTQPLQLQNNAVITTDVPLASRIDDQTPVLYVGKAPVGSATSAAVWQIHKIDETTGVVITWAGGGQFNQIYDNRASLTYS